MRYDPDAEPIATDARDRQADAVDCNGAFLDDVAHDRRWRSNVEHVVLTIAFKAPYLPACIDVAEHKMAVEPRIGAEGTLEVDEGPALYKFKIRPLKGFVEHIELQDAVPRTNNSQACAVDGDAVAYAQCRPNPGSANGQFRRTLARADLLNLTRLFNDSREHA